MDSIGSGLILLYFVLLLCVLSCFIHHILFSFCFVSSYVIFFYYIVWYHNTRFDGILLCFILFDLTWFWFDSIWRYSNRTGEGGRATLFPGDGFSLSWVCIPLLARLFMDLAVWTACDFFQYRNPTTAAKQNPTSAATALQAEEIALDVPVVPVYRGIYWDFKGKLNYPYCVSITVSQKVKHY